MGAGLESIIETDRVILKNNLQGERKGPPREFQYVCHGSGKDDWERFLVLEKAYLDERFSCDEHEGLTLADRIFSYLLEQIPNFQFHANRGDPNTPLHAYRWRDDNRLYYLFKGEGKFDPRTVRVSWENPDGTVFHGVRRKVGDLEGIGGTGHIVMVERCGLLMYDATGTSSYAIFDIPDEPMDENHVA